MTSNCHYWEVCGNAASRGLLCNLHDHRARDGKPMLDPVRRHRGAALKEDVSYATAHHRPKRLWGSASHYPCVKCGETARDWAYDHTDESERAGENSRGQSVMFSVWPEFYMPLCRVCHAALDHPGEVSENPDW